MGSCASRSKHFFPELLTCCQVLQLTGKCRLGHWWWGKNPESLDLVAFLAFAGKKVTKKSNLVLCTPGCRAAWPFSVLTVSPCTTSLLKGLVQPGPVAVKCNFTVCFTISWRIRNRFSCTHTGHIQNSEGKHVGSCRVISRTWGITGGFVMAFPQQLCQTTGVVSTSFHLHSLCRLHN